MTKSIKKTPLKLRNIHQRWGLLGMMRIWRPWKFPNFQDPLPTLCIYIQSSSTSLTLDVQFQTNHLPPSLLSLNDNQSIQGWLFMLSSPSFKSAFVFSINSLILCSFPLTSFHLAEAPLSASSCLYTLVYAVHQKYQIFFIYNYSHFWY